MTQLEKIQIPFNWPYMTGKELYYIAEAHFNGKLAGDGPFTKKCHQWLESRTGANKVLLTHSCTAALEMSALLLDLKPGDEIIMPSYTFVSTANAFVLRGDVTISLCMRCGAEKFGVFNPCKRCAYVPVEDDDIVWAMCVSDHHMDEPNRRQVAKQVKAGAHQRQGRSW